MPSFNSVTLVGGLTRDPEIKYSPKGTAIADFTIAVNRNYATDSGEKREEVSFIDCSAFARVAEVIGEYCKKGRTILVAGRLQQERWEKDGQKRSKVKVVVEQMQLLGGKPEGESSEKPSEQSTRRPPQPPPRPPADPDLDAQPDDIPF